MTAMAVGAVAAYLLGAIPIGFLIARAFGVDDIRRHGSGSIGMTNVMRTAGKVPAILTLLGDAAKGAIAVVIGTEVTGLGMTGAAACAVAAVVGNCWSVFLGFRGGKGVATGLGALLMLVKLAIIPAAIVFAVVAYTTRLVSLGSLLAASGVPIAALALGYPWAAVTASGIIALIIVGRHHENIGRLIKGTESRVGERVKRA